MSAHDRQVSDLYQTDLERHLFAPAAGRSRQQGYTLSLEPLKGWLRDRLSIGWSRSKAVAQAAYLG
jgi:hypothetical protein